MCWSDNWMSKLPGGLQLCNIVLPGSHDAGMYVVKKTKGVGNFGGKESILTQKLRIGKQMLAGARFFDIRVYKTSNQLRLGHLKELTKGKSGFGGGYGDKLYTVLEDVATTMKKMPGETVILKFSHIDKENADQILTLCNVLLKDYLYHHHGLHTLGRVSLERMRGKIITIFNKAFFNKKGGIIKRGNVLTGSHKWVIPIEKSYPSKKGIKWANRCFILEGSFAKSCDLKTIVNHQEENLSIFKKARERHLKPGQIMQLYWTATATSLYTLNISKNTQKIWEQKAVPFMVDLIKKYRPNIVMHDFVDMDKCKTIIDCNNRIKINIDLLADL